jgi:hypothetical protein
MTDKNDGSGNKQSGDGSKWAWQRKGNLTSKPSDSPQPPSAEIGGSGSGQVPKTAGESGASESGSGDSSGKE